MRLRNIKINSFYSKKLKYILITIILIITHGALINNFTSDFDISRFFFSIIYLACMLFSAFLVFLLRNKFSDINFLRAATFFCYFLIVIGYLAFFGFNISGAAGKPIFYFDEPWKFAAAFSPFFLFRLIKARDPEKILLAALAFNLSLLFSSTTLFIISTVFPLIFLKFRLLFKIFFIYFFISILFHTAGPFEQIYVRLPSIATFLSDNIVTDINPDLHGPLNPTNIKNKYFDKKKSNDVPVNQSLAVFYSGWLRGALNFRLSNGVGIGFQQLGFRGVLDKFAIYLYPLNLLDGGTTGAKFFSEFGLCGALLICAYLKALISKILNIRFYLRCQIDYVGNLKNINLFLELSYILFSVNLFIRGAGYFDISCYLFILSLFFYNSKTIKPTKKTRLIYENIN